MVVVAIMALNSMVVAIMALNSIVVALMDSMVALNMVAINSMDHSMVALNMVAMNSMDHSMVAIHTRMATADPGEANLART